MQTSSLDLRALMQAGVEALRRGDASGARALFETATVSGRADASAWLGLALACRVLKEAAATLAALDRALALEPRNLRALILKGDHLAEAGDSRAAAAFYTAAVKAAPSPQQMPADLAAEVHRAQAQCERYAREYENFLRAHMAGHGFDEGRSSRRFAQSLDILFGRKQVYVQEPKTYYFPELPQVQFYERERFPWLDGVEAAAADIRAELLEVLNEDGAFQPYVEGEANRPQNDYQGMVGNPAWSAYYLWKNCQLVPEHAARCPKTLEALSDAPLARIEGRTPSILFSLLKPGARIPPHNGLINARLICHLPLVVPEHCGFRVGNETRAWEEGRAWVFDDTIEHEAWNGGGETRVVLLFDVWRPELSEEEREFVTAMFGAIDAYGGQESDWGE